MVTMDDVARAESVVGDSSDDIRLKVNTELNNTHINNEDIRG